MPLQDPSPVECCQYCPYRESVTGSCQHDIRQAIIKQVSEDDHSICPVFRDVRAQAMNELFERLDSQI